MVLKLSHWLFRLFAMALVVVVMAVVLLGARLASGPVQLTWLAPYIERAIQPADPQVRIEVGGAALRLGEDQLIELVGVDVRAMGPESELLFELAEIEIGLSLRALLAEGMLAPERLQATAPRLVLARNPDGGIGLAGLPADASRRPRGEMNLAALLAPFLMPEPGHPSSYLDSLGISGGQLVLEDRITGQTVTAQSAELAIRRDPAGLVAGLVFELEQNGGRARVETDAAFDISTEQISFDVAFSRLRASELQRIAPALPLEGLAMVVDGHLTGIANLAGRLSSLDFELQSSEGLIERPDLLIAPLPVAGMHLRGRLDTDFAGVVIDELRLEAKGARFEASGELGWEEGGLAVHTKVTARDVAARDLALFWPPRLGREARQWVVENITDGVVPSAEATIRFRPGDLATRPVPEASVAGRFAFDDLTIRYFETMPPLTGVDGSASFTARRMDFAVTSGQVGEIRLEGGSVVITGIGIKGRDTTQLKIEADVRSTVDQALALIDHPPLGFASDLGIAPASASGQATTRLTIGMPLHRELEASEVRVAAVAELSDAGIAGLREGVNLSDGRFHLEVDNAGARLTGEGAVNQVPLEIAWQENFADDAAQKRRFDVRGMLDPDALARFGVALPVPAEGSFGLDATISVLSDQQEADVALDLGPLGIALPWLDWRKAAGEPGQLTASLRFADQAPIRIESFELTGAGLEVAGSLQLSTEPLALDTLNLVRFRLGATEGTLDLRRLTGDGYQIAIRADSLDLDPLREAEGQLPESDAPTPVRLTLTAGTVLSGGHRLSNVDAVLARTREGWQSATIQAALPGGGGAILTLAPENGSRRLRVTSDDAGDLLRTLDQSTRIQGGRLELDAVLHRQVPRLQADGDFAIRDFTLLDAPLLARLLTVASLTGIGNLLGGEGIYFDRLKLPFTLRDGRLAIEKGRMSGSQLGLTVRGQVDLDREELDLDATIVPIYALNRVIGKIPLVGPFLAGQEGEGAFAVTYAVRGPLSEPTITVNPLAVLAPGFIRDLFSGLLDGSLEPPRETPDSDD